MPLTLVTINQNASSIDAYAGDVFTAGLLTILGSMWFVVLALSVLYIVAYWKLFAKADEPGWASIVPFYCNYVLFKIAFGNGWLFLLSFVPVANIVMAIILPFKLAKAFDKDIGWGFGLLFLSCIFYPMLAFGSAEYVGLER